MFLSSVVHPGARNPAGMTPTIRYESVSKRTSLLRMRGSLAKARFHSPSLMRTSPVNPGE
jgi:hypothetical protein